MNLKMKTKNEEEKMKIFSTCLKYFNLYFSETLNFADFKQGMYSDFSYLASIKSYNPSKQAKNGRKWAKTGKIDPL